MGDQRRRHCKYCGKTPRRGQGICRECEARPKADNIKLHKTLVAFAKLSRYLTQSNISAGNIKTMDSMHDIDDEPFSRFLELVREIARVRPFKRRRWKHLRQNYPDLWNRIRQNEHFDWLLEDEYDDFHEELSEQHEFDDH
jgi:hypothetical protein